MFKKSFGLYLALTCCPLLTMAVPTESKLFSFSEGKVFLTTKAGNVTFNSGPKDEVVVSYQKKTWESDCKLEFSQARDELSIHVKSAQFTRSECKIEFNIELPKKVFVSKIQSGSGDVIFNTGLGETVIKMGSGDLKINPTTKAKVAQNVEINMGSVDMDLSTEVKSLKVKGGSGDLDFNGVFSDADIRLGSGEAFFHFAESSSPLRLDYSGGSGDVRMQLVQKLIYSTNLRTGSGRIKDLATKNDRSEYVLNVTTGSGDITLKQ